MWVHCHTQHIISPLWVWSFIPSWFSRLWACRPCHWATLCYCRHSMICFIILHNHLWRYVPCLKSQQRCIWLNSKNPGKTVYLSESTTIGGAFSQIFPGANIIQPPFGVNEARMSTGNTLKDLGTRLLEIGDTTSCGVLVQEAWVPCLNCPVVSLLNTRPLHLDLPPCLF